MCQVQGSRRSHVIGEMERGFFEEAMIGTDPGGWVRFEQIELCAWGEPDVERNLKKRLEIGSCGACVDICGGSCRF